MAARHVTASPTPGPSKTSDYGLIADAIYDYCRDNHGPEEILVQDQLFKPDIIPNKDLNILLQVCQHLVNQHLFKTHELRGGGFGWKLNTRERAENYKDLSTDETLVYSIIESAGTTGIWTKTIKQRLNIHAKVTERAFKTLEGKGIIEPMKDVKFPSRKMYILKGLKPSDEATGGAWFTDGVLDMDMLEVVADVIEKLIGERSWVEVKIPALPENDTINSVSTTQKRKQPQDGFDLKNKGKGKEKMPRVDIEEDRDHTPSPGRALSEKHQSSKTKPKAPLRKSYDPHPPDYRGYPTLSEVTNEVNRNGVLARGLLPQNAIAQLLDVMVYDDKLNKITTPSDFDDQSPKVMYKTVNNPAQIKAAGGLRKRLRSENEDIRKAAVREHELEELGSGGLTEVPCTRCPVFHLCDDGGPVNVENCVYFDDWFRKLEELQARDGEIM